jgi:hypothetical protein
VSSSQRLANRVDQVGELAELPAERREVTGFAGVNVADAFVMGGELIHHHATGS